MCGPKGQYGFSAVLVINRVSNLVDSGDVINRVRSLYSSLNMGIFLRKSHFSIITKMENQQTPFTNYVYGNLKISLNNGTNYNAGLKQDFHVRVGS